MLPIKVVIRKLCLGSYTEPSKRKIDKVIKEENEKLKRLTQKKERSLISIIIYVNRSFRSIFNVVRGQLGLGNYTEALKRKIKLVINWENEKLMFH